MDFIDIKRMNEVVGNTQLVATVEEGISWGEHTGHTREDKSIHIVSGQKARLLTYGDTVLSSKGDVSDDK